ncbi:DUF2911 domain-containing protein [Fulvivirgaceae bacterium BMA10]|uniref:DUF2911 domain-containing protein n=1 Tax=Splendidivirga corallicola TaxID=3051826 RepID=A0ABT8KSB0_9BACT|nr:DUF2911 domain-containing protein [Fulvivirgaceae bacterium BMA10]
MRKFLIIGLLVLVSSGAAFSQFRGLDRSPLDIAYFPDNFAHDRQAGEKAIVKVTYSRPQKKSREIFGGIVRFDQVWRTGANEATEIKFYQDVTIAGKKIKKGVYSLFTIPGKEKWTIIINSDLDYWGHYSYNEKNDVLRTEVAVGKTSGTVEAFTIQFRNADGGAAMQLAWDDTLVEVPVKF